MKNRTAKKTHFTKKWHYEGLIIVISLNRPCCLPTINHHHQTSWCFFPNLFDKIYHLVKIENHFPLIPWNQTFDFGRVKDPTWMSQEFSKWLVNGFWNLYIRSTPQPLTVSNEGIQGFPTKNGISLVLTVTGRGVVPSYITVTYL